MAEAVLGIDGGATRTRAVLITESGHLLGYGQSGPTNYDTVGIKNTTQHLTDAINQTLHQANSPTLDIKSVFLGMAGVVSQSDRNVILEIASGIPIIKDADLQVDHDLRIALPGGLIGAPGDVLIVGTGSSCYGENRQGQKLRVGGWGHLLDDGGSSYYLGLQALISIIRAADGRIPPTLLSKKVMQNLEITDVENIMWRVYHRSLQPIEIAALAPLVIDAAEMGDTTSLKIINNGVHELALLVLTAASRLGYNSGESADHEKLRIALTGGLVKASRLYRETLLSAIYEILPASQVQQPVLPPVFGAALLALNTSGISANLDLIEALKEGASLIASSGDSL